MPQQAATGLENVLPVPEAKVVAASAQVCGAVGSLASSGGGGVGAVRRISLVGGASDCAYDESRLEPSATQYPLSFSLDEGGPLSLHVVGVASSCAALLALVALGGFVGRLSGRKRPVRYVRWVEAVCHHFIGASLAEGFVLIVRHSSVAVHVWVAWVCVAIEVVIVSHRAFVVGWRVPREVMFVREPCGFRGTIKGCWKGELAETYGPFFVMARDEGSVAVRMTYFIDLACSMAMGCANGWRPLDGDCAYVAGVVLAPLRNDARLPAAVAPHGAQAVRHLFDCACCAPNAAGGTVGSNGYRPLRRRDLIRRCCDDGSVLCVRSERRERVVEGAPLRCSPSGACPQQRPREEPWYRHAASPFECPMRRQYRGCQVKSIGRALRFVSLTSGSSSLNNEES